MAGKRLMKLAITKEEFIKKLGPSKTKSLEKRLGIDFQSNVTIEEIMTHLEKNTDLLLDEIKVIQDILDNETE